MRVNFYTNACTSKFKDNGGGIWALQGIPMTVDNAVMNGIYYPEDENAKGLNTYKGKPVALRHPSDENGNPTSAASGAGLFNYYSGGVITNVYNHNGINYFDAEFNVNMMRAQKNGDYFADKIEKKEPIGVSTGLYFDGNNEEGVTANGEKYIAVAKNQQGDHVAMLPDDEPPAGGKDTFIRFNGENNDQTMAVNIDEFIESLSNIDNNADDKKSLFNQLKEWLLQTIASSTNDKDNNQVINKTDEVDAMKREELIAALNAQKVEFKEDATDAELLVQLVNSGKADNSELVSTINSLKEEVKTLKSELASNADKELDSLAEKAAPLLGVEKDEAKSLGANALHKVLAKNGVVVGGAVVSGKSEEETKVGLNAKMPWEE